MASIMENDIIRLFAQNTVRHLEEQWEAEKKLYDSAQNSVSIGISLKEAFVSCGAEKIEFSINPKDEQCIIVVKVFKDGIPKEIQFLPNNSPANGEVAFLHDAFIEDVHCIASMKHLLQGDNLAFRCRWNSLVLRKEIKFTGAPVD